MNDLDLLQSALLRPKRYQGMSLTFEGTFVSSPERLEDETAYNLSLEVGDAVAYQVLAGRSMVTVFAQGAVADWLEEHWKKLHRPDVKWRLSGTWLFGITWAYTAVNNGQEQWVPSSEYGLLLETVPEGGKPLEV